MNMRWGSNGAQVGALLVVFAVLLFFGLQFLGLKIGEHHRFYHIILNNASGVTRGAPVAMAGVKVGTISRIDLDKFKSARLTVQMEPGYLIPSGSRAEIPSSLIGLGETQVNIIAPEQLTPPLPPGSDIPGTHLDAVGSLLPEGRETVKELTLTLRAARHLLEGGFGASVEKTLASSQVLMAKFGRVADQLQGVIASNRGQLSGALASASAAMADIQKAAGMATGLLQKGHFSEQLTGLMQSLTATSEKAGKLVASLDGFVNDQGMRQALNKTLSNTADLTAQGKEIAGSFKTIAANGETVSAEAITLTKRATEVADEAKTLLSKLEALVNKVGNKLDLVSPPKNPVGTITGEGDLVHEISPGYSRIDYNFIIPIGKEKVYAGVFDAFEANQLNLQLSRPLIPGATLRYGAYAGKAGLGVDYKLASRVGLRGDLFDINNPRFDLRAKYDFGGGFVGWLGYDRLWLKNNLTFGIGFQK
jgi:ABC-type transporter Mla subunit MlaD